MLESYRTDFCAAMGRHGSKTKKQFAMSKIQHLLEFSTKECDSDEKGAD